MPTLDPTVLYVAMALRALWLAPLWARRVLAFLRDLDDYRGPPS